MENITLKIIDPIGLHARPASKIVQIASRLSSVITIESNNKVANIKSIISIMSLGIKKGQEVIIKAEGTNAMEDLKKIQEVMKSENLI